jgi:hypothetical protein
MLHTLPLQDGAAPKISTFAHDLYEIFLFANQVTGARRKARSASPNSVKRQLEYIERGSNTLLKRLRNASTGVFQAWATAADAADDAAYEELLYEWLQLKRLLEYSAERAKRAAKKVVPKPGVSGNRGRPSHDVAAAVTVVAAKAYEELTGRDAVRRTDRDTRQPLGKFHEFLTAVFKELGIDSSPDAANMQLQPELRRLRNTNKK